MLKSVLECFDSTRPQRVAVRLDSPHLRCYRDVLIIALRKTLRAHGFEPSLLECVVALDDSLLHRFDLFVSFRADGAWVMTIEKSRHHECGASVRVRVEPEGLVEVAS